MNTQQINSFYMFARTKNAALANKWHMQRVYGGIGKILTVAERDELGCIQRAWEASLVPARFAK